jgi:cold shock CspA family protein
VRLFADYGFAEAPDGQEVYFHKNSVADNAFDKLEVGSEVRLVIAENEGVEGAQASTVTPIGKHHIVEG